MPSFFQDLRLAIRSLRKSPGIVLVAVVSLGLGAGVNTAFFNVFHAVFLQKPTALDPDRLVRIEPGDSDSWAYDSYRDIRDRHIFPGLAAYSLDFFSLRTGADVQPITGLLVSGNFFDVMGSGPARGRGISADESDAERNPDVAILSDVFAKRRFGAGDPLGASINVDARVYRVIGVLPEKYRPILGALIPDLYLPFNDSNLPARVRSNAGLRVFARLAENMSPQQARSVFLAQAKDLERTSHREGFGRTAFLLPIYGIASWQQRGQPAGQLYALLSMPFVIFGMVLLIACANVAGVLIARGASRGREVAIRTALGAGRRRIFQMLFAESLVLSILGTAAGLLLALWTTDLAVGIPVPGLPFRLQVDVQMQPMVLAYALLMAILTALFCGLTPAWQIWRPDLTRAMRAEGGSMKHPRLRLRNLMVAVQAAVSVVLLLVSVLMLRSLTHIAHVDPGFDRDHVLSAQVELERDTPPPQRIAFAQGMVQRARSLPGVEAASVTSLVPLAGNAGSTQVTLEQQPDRKDARALWMNVGPDYFKTLGIPVLRGREFGDSDRRGSAPVAIVNAAFAKAYFRNREALGQRVRVALADPYREIVGIVRDSDYQFYGEPAQPQLFRPFYQTNGEVFLQLRTRGTVNDYREPLIRAAAELNGRAVVDVKTLREATGLEFQIRRLLAGVLAATGGLGLLLAMVGLYGVLSYAVSRSTPEIGIRMALGASRGVVLRAVMRQGLVLVGAGIVAGCALALGAAQLIAFALGGISPADPIAYLTTAGFMLAAGLAATWIPARRAARIEPMAALRYE